MDWSNKTVMRFLELYRMHPCIWDPKNRYHKRKEQVDKAWLEIKNDLNEACTVYMLKKKRESLMSAYRAYRVKVKKSECLASTSSDVYQPTWFAYSFMDSFLRDVYKCRSPVPTENTREQEVQESNTGQDDSDGDDTDISTVDQDSSNSLIRRRSIYRSPRPATATKRRQNSESDSEQTGEFQQVRSQMNQAFELLRSVQQQHVAEEDESGIFGKLVAQKMRNLPQDRRDWMMVKINQLFYEEHSRNILHDP